ncbi:monoacylglycerol lipase [[Candida] anglica]|uniref:Monoacylglycerol lipase n=1 Tax=[Candida] anglica TaxID=148631 RepID=A0ABP0EAJ3_9ASCO
MFWSKVENTVPINPATFTKVGDSGEQKTLAQIVQDASPSLADGYSFFVNPLLAGGHLQTAYTGTRKFGDVDLVRYGRRLLHIDPEDHGYVVEGEKLKYDSYAGESTITVDYVLNNQPKATASASQGAVKIPSSQDGTLLPPRTTYISQSDEDKILSDQSRPLLIALHGLSGGSYEAYVRSLLHEITGPEFDFDAVVVNSRGCAGHTPTTPQLFNGLWTNDVRYYVNEVITKKYPDKKIYLIGFSLGGAILGNFLAQESDHVHPNICGAAIMGSPWDFVDSCVQLEASWIGSRVYSPVMSQNLQKLLLNHKDVLSDNPLVSSFVENPKNFDVPKLKDFDDTFTSKFFGFNCASEYYRRASPIQRLLKIRVPTVIVSSLDDPIAGNTSLPYSEVQLNPYTMFVTTTIGGHLGWFTSSSTRWYPKPISQLFKELHKNWTVNKVDEEHIPSHENTIWRHDRLIL